MVQTAICIILLVAAATASAAKIGFHAKMSPSTKISVGETLRFNSILLNDNGGNPSHYGYRSSTGHFLCPVNGIYSFSTHLMTTGVYMEFEMRKNAQIIMYLLLDGAEGRWKTDGGTVDIQCNRGESVYVVGRYRGPVTIHHLWSWFSGHLVEAN